MLAWLKIWIGKVLFHPLVGSLLVTIFRGCIPSRGFVFDVNNPYISKRNAALLFWQAYEGNEIRHLHRYLRRDLDVIELGSGIGVISTEIARIQQPARKLICVEANPHLIPTFEKNLHQNVPEKKVGIFNQALDYSGAGQVKLYFTSDNLDSKVSSNGQGEQTCVEATRLAELLKRCEIEDFVLVCDIEGAEAGMIIEDAEALDRCRQMLIELHPTTYNGQEYSVTRLREKIEAHGFRLVASRRDVFVFVRNK